MSVRWRVKTHMKSDYFLSRWAPVDLPVVHLFFFFKRTRAHCRVRHTYIRAYVREHVSSFSAPRVCTYIFPWSKCARLYKCNECTRNEKDKCTWIGPPWANANNIRFLQLSYIKSPQPPLPLFCVITVFLYALPLPPESVAREQVCAHLHTDVHAQPTVERKGKRNDVSSTHPFPTRPAIARPPSVVFLVIRRIVDRLFWRSLCNLYYHPVLLYILLTRGIYTTLVRAICESNVCFLDCAK